MTDDIDKALRAAVGEAKSLFLSEKPEAKLS